MRDRSSGPLIWLTLAALSLRAAALALTARIPCVLDECSYLTLARDLAAGRGFLPHAGHFWPPGYVAALAAVFASGGGVLTAKAAQVVLSTLLVPLTFACARRALSPCGEEASRRGALWAAALIAFDPTLIAFSHYVWPETLFLPLFLGGLFLVSSAGTRLRNGLGALPLAAAAGLLLGVACLVKVVPLYLLPLLAVWLARMPATPAVPGARRARGLLGPGFTAGLLLLAAAGAAIAPWTLRNALAYGRLVLIETTAGKNLVRGNNPYAPSNWDWGDYRRTPALPATGCLQADLIERDRCLTRAGLSHIASHPGQFVTDAGIKLADLLNPTSFAVRHIRLGAYGDWPRPVASAIVVAIALFNAGLMGLAAFGWGRMPASPWRSLALLVVVYLCAVHVLTFGMSRFRLPLEPLLAMGAAAALTIGAGEAPPRNLRRRLAPLLVLLVLLACWARRVDGLFHEPGPGEPLPALGVDSGGPE